MSENESGISTGNLFEDLDEHTSFTNDTDTAATPITWGIRFAELFTMIFASWSGILVQVGFLITWIIVNQLLLNAFDPYPYGFYSTILTSFGVIASMFVLMSQSRADTRQESILNEMRIGIMKQDAIASMIMETQFQIIQQNETILFKQDAIIRFLKGHYAQSPPSSALTPDP